MGQFWFIFSLCMVLMALCSAQDTSCSDLDAKIQQLDSKVTQILNALDSKAEKKAAKQAKKKAKKQNKESSAVYEDCAQYLAAGFTEDGVYTLTLASGSPFDVYCDQTTDGGGWIVFQKRQDGSVEFYNDYVVYQDGFGNVAGEYWLGLDHLRTLTQNNDQELRVDLEDFDGDIRHALYNEFSIGPADDEYRLAVSGYQDTSDAGDSFLYHSTGRFSTRDIDNDEGTRVCAVSFHGAWWYRDCHSSNLNGGYLGGPHSTFADGIEWEAFRGQNYSLKRSEMKIRPRG